jgi:hypothetical protein
MTKGKYKAKRERARQRAKQKAEQPKLSVPAAIGTQKIEPANNPEADTHKKNERTMPPGEIAKRSTITEKLLVVFTCALAVLGYFQWRTSDSQLNVMRNDERAWIEVLPKGDDKEALNISFTVGQPVGFPVTIKNTGKTPAKNVTIRLFVEIVDASQSPPLDWVSDHTHHPHNQITTGIFFPGAHIDQVMVRTRGKVTDPLVATQTEIDSILASKSYVSAFGIVTYDDIFGYPHWLKFCSWISEKGDFMTEKCTAYNSVDEK